MDDLFRSYWWLLFPLGWFVVAGFRTVVGYYRHKDVLKLIKTYADKGQEPPESLLRALENTESDDGCRSGGGTHMRNGAWFSVAMFGVMALGFGYASLTDMFGLREPFFIVAFVMAAVGLGSLVQALLGRRRRLD